MRMLHMAEADGLRVLPEKLEDCDIPWLRAALHDPKCREEFTAAIGKNPEALKWLNESQGGNG